MGSRTGAPRCTLIGRTARSPRAGDVGPGLADRVAARLKLSNKARKRLALAAERDPGADPRATAYWIGLDSATDRLLLADRSADAADLATWSVPRLPISGGELIKRGVPQGPAVAATLQGIEREWVARGFPDGEKWGKIVAARIASAKGG